MNEFTDFRIGNRVKNLKIYDRPFPEAADLLADAALLAAEAADAALLAAALAAAALLDAALAAARADAAALLLAAAALLALFPAARLLLAALLLLLLIERCIDLFLDFAILYIYLTK